MTPALQSVLSPAGPDAALLSRFGWMLFGAGTLIFLLVALLVLASVVRKRGRSWSRRLVVGGGLLVPVPLLAALMGWSGWQASLISWPFSGTRIQVTVTAHMWWWEVRYRDTVSGREAVLANELRLPVGERVYLALASADVLHAFWVPALAGKVDMVPGRIHGLTLRADAPGRYRGQCAEYCGIQHAAMALDAVALAPGDFDGWLARQAAPAVSGAAAGAVARRGREVFLAARCNACHTVRGVSEGGTLGPDLTHLASRSHIAAGALPLSRAALTGWIADPQAAKPGARMPHSRLPPDQLQALASWLETLQ
ncbi:c-type cytochrome [Duganella sp. Root198D2]|uniref:cytochrome c oxidase subunit II n=1 Tax=Duganella sp. Root198D2 TaxID=1736489 RepID=UPI000710854B|nr:c-type cytochrome [Duganella sp. Root198D2]KRB92508.1 cytochrome C oxidase subunit II [Duganella sp. Root198D2]